MIVAVLMQISKKEQIVDESEDENNREKRLSVTESTINQNYSPTCEENEDNQWKEVIYKCVVVKSA